jgi:hypothetical protein
VIDGKVYGFTVNPWRNRSGVQLWLQLVYFYEQSAGTGELELAAELSVADGLGDGHSVAAASMPSVMCSPRNQR